MNMRTAIDLVEVAQKENGFDRWFAGSKVVDPEGKPLIVFHGTRRGGFSTFAHNKHSRSEGFFFTGSRELALTYSGMDNDLDGTTGARAVRSGVYPVYLSLKHPKFVDWNGDYFQNAAGVHTHDVVAAAKAEGFDGVIIRNVNDPGGYALAMQNRGLVPKGADTVGDIYVAFSPSQIKSAIGNKGTYASEVPDINEQLNRSHALL